MHICLIIPAYEASRTIRCVVSEALKSGYPVLVVDDGSRVCSSVFLAGLPVTVLGHPVHLGKGRALRSGFEWAARRGYSGVITLDAEVPEPVEAIRSLAAAAASGDADILLALPPEQPATQSLQSRCSLFAQWWLCKKIGATLAHAPAAPRYYSCAVVQELLLDSDGPHLDTEVLLKAARRGDRLASVPLPDLQAAHLPTGKPHPVLDALTTCLALVRYG